MFSFPKLLFLQYHALFFNPISRYVQMIKVVQNGGDLTVADPIKLFFSSFPDFRCLV